MKFESDESELVHPDQTEYSVCAFLRTVAVAGTLSNSASLASMAGASGKGPNAVISGSLDTQLLHNYHTCQYLRPPCYHS
jgi:hypothetical protein